MSVVTYSQLMHLRGLTPAGFSLLWSPVPGSGVAGGGGREAREAGGVARAGERREPSRLLEKATDEAPNLAMFEGKSGTNPAVS